MLWSPLISVVIPTYNRAPRTIAAVESVLAQTYRNYEILVVDDGSTDGSGEAIQRFLSQRTSPPDQAPPIHYFKQSNQGPSAARNAGVAQARGDYVAFLDSDDLWLPEKLEWQVRAMEQFKNDCGACYTDSHLVTDSGADRTTFQVFGRCYEQTVGIETDAVRLIAQSFCGFWVSTLLARTDLLKQIGGFDSACDFCEDRDLSFRLSLVTSLAYVNKALARADRTSRPKELNCRPWEKADVRLRSEQNMYEKWLGPGMTIPPNVRGIIAWNLRKNQSVWANWYLELGRYKEARRSAYKALTFGITLGTTVKWMLAWLAPSLARRLAPKSLPYS